MRGEREEQFSQGKIKRDGGEERQLFGEGRD
jgi:hypothetical protein